MTQTLFGWVSDSAAFVAALRKTEVVHAMSG